MALPALAAIPYLAEGAAATVGALGIGSLMANRQDSTSPENVTYSDPQRAAYEQMGYDLLFGGPMKAIEWGNGGGVQEGPMDEGPKAPMAPTEFPGLSAADFLPSSTTLPPAPPEDPRYTSPMAPSMSGKYEGSEMQDPEANLMYAVKEKGGNWQDNAISDLAKVVKLDSGMMGNLEQQQAHTQSKQEEIDEIDRQIVGLEKRKLEFVGTEKEQAFQNAIDARIRDKDVLFKDLQAAKNNELIQNWVDTKFTKYAQTDLGTPTDPVLDVLEKYSTNIYMYPDVDFMTGGRDATARGTYERIEQANKMRAEFGQQSLGENLGSRYPDRPTDTEGYTPETIIGEATPAQLWEMQTDSLLSVYPSLNSVRSAKAENPENYPAWMDRVPPETQIHRFDETRVNERLKGYENSMWEQFADETTKALPGMPSTIDALRKGLSPELYDLEHIPDELRLKPSSLDKMSVPQAVDHAAKLTEWQTTNKLLDDRNNKVYTTAMDMGGGFEWKKIGNKTTDQKTIDEIKKALTFESDHMNHCVGRGELYCNKITGGNTAIYTLRDPKGLPHATIEMTIDIPNQVKNDILSQTHDSMIDADPDDIVASTEMALTRWASENPDKLVRTIEQVKGHGDRKPAEQYIPMVQKFVIEHPYPISDINMDQGNTDLVKLDTLSQSARAKFDQLFPDNNGIWGREEDVEKVKTEYFAKGGYVGNLSAADFLPR